MRFRLLALLVLAGAWLMAGDANAQAWKTCDATHAAGRVVTGVAPSGGSSTPKTACYDFTDLTDSAILAVGSCENFDLIFNPDMATTDTVGQANVLQCVAPTGTTANICATPIGDTTLTGATDALGVIYGAAAVWILVDPQANPLGDLSRLMVRCNGPAN